MRRGAFLLLLAGCWSTTFQPSDPAWRAARKPAKVEVYFRAPARPYAAVGTIVVEPPGASASVDEVVARATDKAREVGCDVLVARGRRRGGEAPGSAPSSNRPGSVIPAQVPEEAVIGAREPGGGGKHEFTCGVYE